MHACVGSICPCMCVWAAHVHACVCGQHMSMHACVGSTCPCMHVWAAYVHARVCGQHMSMHVCVCVHAFVCVCVHVHVCVCVSSALPTPSTHICPLPLPTPSSSPLPLPSTHALCLDPLPLAVTLIGQAVSLPLNLSQPGRHAAAAGHEGGEVERIRLSKQQCSGRGVQGLEIGGCN